MRDSLDQSRLGYLVAVGATALVMVFRLAASGVLGTDAPFLMFVSAVLAASWIGGFGPGLLATVLGACAGTYLASGSPPANVSGEVRLVAFVIIGALASWMIEAMHVSKRRIEDQRAKLQANEDFHRIIAELTSDYAWTARVEADGRLVTEAVTEGFARLMGCTLDEMLARGGWPTIIHPDDLPEAEAAQARLLSGQSIEGELRYVTTRGEVLQLHYLTRPVKDEAGRVVRAHGAVQNVTAQKRTESDLREWRDRYEAAARSSGHVLYDNNRAIDEVVYGGDCERILGYTAEELRGPRSKWIALIHPDDRAHFIDAVHRVQSERGKHIEYRLTRKDGREIRVEHDGHVVGAGPAPQRVVGFVKDVTERRRAEDVLRHSEHRFRTLVEQAVDGILVLANDSRILDANPAACELLGYSCEEILGRKATDLIDPHSLELQPPVELREGETVERERPWRRKDGTLVLVEARARRLDDHTSISFLRDVTAKRRAEEALRRAEERFRASQEASLFGFSILRSIREPGGRIVDFEWEYVNPTAARLLLRPVDTLVGHRLLEVLPDSDQIRALFSTYVRVAETGLPQDIELRYETAGLGGWYRHMTVRCGDGVAVSLTDMTDRKRLEDQLRERAEALAEADRRKDEFLAVLAHELRNPLAPLRHGLEIMRIAKDDASAVEHARTVMERQIGQMVRIIDDLLDVSRITRGKIDLRREKIDVATAVQSAVEASRPLLQRHGHDLTVTLPAEPTYLNADLTRLSQVFLNLIHNAIKYTDDQGRIHILAERRGADVVVAVRDSGVGIPPDMLARVFDLFTQVDQSLDRAQGGLGIGLTLVKRLVELHGGTVEARSDGVGCGSEFMVRLPILVQSGDARGAIGEAATAADDSAPRRILVADDNLDSATSLAMMLRIRGHEVRTAVDGVEALEVAQVFGPDVMLLDIGMPRLNGFEAALRVRQSSWGRSVTLIALTGWGQEEDRRRSEAAGFDHHLVKPVDPGALGRLLATIRPDPGLRVNAV